jgi:outer membrane protein OmpA-like peptidoglycan-associated protein
MAVIIQISSCFGQLKPKYQLQIETGDQYAREDQYHLAIDHYTTAVRMGATVPALFYKLAECYRKDFDYSRAEESNLKVIQSNSNDFPLALYYYALMLKLNGKSDESIKHFDEFMTVHQENKSLKEFVEQAAVDKSGCEMIRLSAKSGDNKNEIVLLPNGINSTFNDYAPAVKNSKALVVTTERILSNRSLIDQRHGEGFADNYYFERNGEGWVDQTKKAFSITNSKFHDGSGSFTRNGEKYYFTKCGEDDPRCKIYVTTYLNSKWIEPILLDKNVNVPNYDAKQPAITPGGDTLYFVSNRPGGFGQNDIWMSIRFGQEQWGPAVNLGKKINTKLNELAPSTTPFTTILFFTSDGHQGFGGMDLYMAKKLSSGDTVLHNLEAPYNSNRDDCFITFSDTEVFWSSNRTEGLGGFDIYSSRISSRISFISKVSLKNPSGRNDVKLKSRSAFSEKANLTVSRNEERVDYHSLTYEKKKIVDKMVDRRIKKTSAVAEVSDISSEELQLLDRIAEERYRDYLLQQQLASTLLTELALPSDSTIDFFITGTVSDSTTGLTLHNLKLLLTDESGEILKITRTNESGQFRFTDIPARTQLFLRVEKLSEQDSRKPYVSALETPASIRTNILYVENIYFDYDLFSIRPEASHVLNDLAAYLKLNPGVQVELFAFADDRGSSEYNLQLTQKRGQAVLDYLTAKGVDQTALAVIPKGKQLPKTTYNEVERQYNRRVEFYLNGAVNTFNNSAKTFILRKQTYWSVLSQQTGIAKDQLKALNGATSELVKSLQPIRIPFEAKAVSTELFFVGL